MVVSLELTHIFNYRWNVTLLLFTFDFKDKVLPIPETMQGISTCKETKKGGKQKKRIGSLLTILLFKKLLYFYAYFFFFR
jgi:hypothetical protein